MTITLQLPEKIEQQLSAEWPDISRKALEALAVEGYREALLSRAEVGEILRLDRWETEDFLKERGLYRQYGTADLETDLSTNRGLLGGS